MGLAQVLFKMDKAGDGQLVELEDLCMNRELCFIGFTPQMFMEVGYRALTVHPVILGRVHPTIVPRRPSHLDVLAPADLHHGRLRLRQGAARHRHPQSARSHAPPAQLCQGDAWTLAVPLLCPVI